MRRLADHLALFGDVESDIVHLCDDRPEAYAGWRRCFERREASCPLKDDRGAVVAKLAAPGGGVFASPDYLFQFSAIMKTFLDRLAFCGNRPHFFGSTFAGIVTQGLPFGAKIGKHPSLCGSCFGFTTVRGRRITARGPMREFGSSRWPAGSTSPR